MTIKFEPYRIGVSGKLEAGYYGITLNSKYYEVSLRDGDFIKKLLSLIEKLVKTSRP